MNDYQDGQENAPLLELRGVSQRYSQGTIDLDVLIDANLTVLAGELKALVGPSGSGKSTLLNIAGLLEPPNAGEVFIGGVNASKLSRSKRGLLRRNDIGFVFQFHRLLPEFSAMENIMIPQMLSGLDRGEAEARALQLLGMVGLQARADFRPGLLSGGEQQRDDHDNPRVPDRLAVRVPFGRGCLQLPGRAHRQRHTVRIAVGGARHSSVLVLSTHRAQAAFAIAEVTDVANALGLGRRGT